MPPHRRLHLETREFHCEPALSLHLYCAGRLDKVVTHVVAPLSTRLTELYGTAYQGLWFFRYSCHGEHLKVRIHAEVPADQLLSQARTLAESFLAKEMPLSRANRLPDTSGPWPIPIDLEDRVDTDHPDCSFLVSHYLRSEVHFGPEPWLHDDRYVAQFCAALAAAAQVICDLTVKIEGNWLHKTRQMILWRLIVAALGSLGGEVTRLREYLNYHRHWLVQYVALGSPSPSQVFLELLEKKRLLLSTALLPLQKIVEAKWLQASEPEPGLRDWANQIAALRTYSETYGSNPEYIVDPIATDVSFAPLFKVLHGVANQLGFLQRDEALTYSILLGCLDPAIPGVPDFPESADVPEAKVS